MTTKTGTNVLTRLHRAFNERDAATAHGLLADDVVWQVPGNHPIAGTYHGREEVWERYIAPFWSTPAQIDDHAALSPCHPPRARAGAAPRLTSSARPARDAATGFVTVLDTDER